MKYLPGSIVIIVVFIVTVNIEINVQRSKKKTDRKNEYKSKKCLIYVICVCLYIVVYNIYCVVLCFVFLRLVYPMFPVSLDCTLLIAPLVFPNVYLSCVLCTLCSQFLWIVHF